MLYSARTSTVESAGVDDGSVRDVPANSSLISPTPSPRCPSGCRRTRQPPRPCCPWARAPSISARHHALAALGAGRDARRLCDLPGLVVAAARGARRALREAGRPDTVAGRSASLITFIPSPNGRGQLSSGPPGTSRSSLIPPCVRGRGGFVAVLARGVDGSSAGHAAARHHPAGRSRG